MTGTGRPARGPREEERMQASTYDLHGWGPPTEAVPRAEHEEFRVRMERLGFHQWFTVPDEDRDEIYSASMYGAAARPRGRSWCASNGPASKPTTRSS